jgi:phage terminase small subunit
MKMVPQLGLSPASRSGLAVIKPPPDVGDNEYSEFDEE